MKKEINLEKENIPRHIAIIMDGNGRWAKEKGKRRTAGHREGSKVLKEICRNASSFNVEYITVYAFSTENWKRPKDEVVFLMDLLRQYLKESISNSKKDNMRVRVIGEREGLPKDIIDKIEELEQASKNNTGLTLQIALNYGGRNEIIRAVKKIAKEYKNDNILLENIDEDNFSRYLDTSDVPEPELMIRTSGEQRLSNFLLWQLAYSEFYFTDKYWPDFKKEDLEEAIIFYQKKERRFGGLADEN